MGINMSIIEINVITGAKTERELTADELKAIEENNKIPVEILTVSMRQARLALLKKNLLTTVESLIITPEQLIWWDYSTTVEKYNPLVNEIKIALNWTDEDLTNLFELAASL